MLATYPIAATEQNWISATLLGALRISLETLQEGNAPPEFDEALSEEYREDFLRGPKFKKAYDLFIAKCRPLTVDQRAQVLTALNEQNNFPGVFTSTTPCCSIKDAFPDVHSAANELFKHAFEKLSEWKTPGCEQTIRAKYHQLVDAHLSHGSCPFCGYEPLEAADPDLVDPDLDHYLAVSIYPFAGVNLRNLTVMGDKCNRSYKGAQDILLDEHSARVDCFDPYGAEQVKLSLEGTRILSGPGEGPAWVIHFDPDIKSRNWRRVFKLETRLRANVLERHYKKWIEHFVSYAQRHGFDITSTDGAIDAVARFKETCEFDSYPAIGRLKTCFFELVEAALNDPMTVDRMRNFLVESA
ncbi:hypothetical protein [Rhizobium bangladeshense]|uniref:hypothetical protein n=1 Tax=Rhizobium bangladeshense TaxID=1138189 RepID=UPI001C83A741|nr:hypothetical protein [Rhizobium bangladeshense]MBX4896553.1 hypothetical protein [Rhizobium bangladeshense]MBY3614001.1 hypothetical protein [Rhizobium bangladeshense]